MPESTEESWKIVTRGVHWAGGELDKVLTRRVSEEVLQSAGKFSR